MKLTAISVQKTPKVGEQLLLLSGSHKALAVDDRILDCVLKLQDITRMINPEMPVTHPERYIRTYMSAQIAVEYKIFQILGEENIASISRTMCLAMQIYINRVPRTFPRGSFFLHKMAQRLKEAMEVALASSAADTDLPPSILWVTVMGAMGSQDGPLRAWFLDQITRLCRSLRVKTQRAGQDLLQTWLWSSQALDNEAVALWGELEDMRSSSELSWWPLSDASP